MPEETATGTSAPEGQAPPAAQTTAPAAPTNTEGQAPTETWDPERARNTISTLREREKALEKQSRDAAAKQKELESRLQEIEDAKLSEAERTAKRLAEVEAQNADLAKSSRDRIIGYEVRLAAARLNIVDPDAAAKLMDATALEFDNAGMPTNAEAVLKALIESKPYLAGSPVSTPAPTAPQTSPTNGATRSAAAGAVYHRTSDIANRTYWTQHSADIMKAYGEGRIRDE